MVAGVPAGAGYSYSVHWTLFMLAVGALSRFRPSEGLLERQGLFTEISLGPDHFPSCSNATTRFLQYFHYIRSPDLLFMFESTSIST